LIPSAGRYVFWQGENDNIIGYEKTKKRHEDGELMGPAEEEAPSTRLAKITE
jgi:hypothetical protein